ncbi:MAG: ANTAR domain-containing protein [Eubacterium sp.]|nr:ANTAR domain-containing protein [Eubacterium sp.]
MAAQTKNDHNVLIVSSYDKFTASVMRVLSGRGYRTIEAKKSASTARREILEKSYDIVLINTPLSDETGVELGIDISDSSSTGVIIAAPGESSEDVAERVTDHGIIVVAKPATGRLLLRNVRLIGALLDKLKGAQKKVLTLEEKMEEIRLVNRAKWILIERDGMSEDEAHRYINKQAMDRCVSKKEIAGEIIG